MRKRIWPRALLFAAIGCILLGIAYFAMLTALNSYAHAVQRLFELGPWMAAIILGFGLQVFLFVYLREAAKRKRASAGTAVAVSGSASVGSMAACCLHHVTDVIPLIGISAAAVLLGRLEGFFLSIAVVSNALGSIFMLWKIQQHSLFPAESRFASRAFSYSMSKAFVAAAVIGTAWLAVSLANAVYL